MTVEQRLEKLEQELATTKRRYRRLLTGGLATVSVIIALLSLMAQTRPSKVQQEVRAREFTLVNERGDIRAVLGEIDGEPGLGLFDSNGQIRVLLNMTESTSRGRSMISLFDSRGKIRTLLSVTGDEPGLSLYDSREGLFWNTPSR